MYDYIRIRLAAMVKNERGATAVEYGLLVALIAAIIVAVVGFLGKDVLGGFDTVENAIGGRPGLIPSDRSPDF